MTRPACLIQSSESWVEPNLSWNPCTCVKGKYGYISDYISLTWEWIKSIKQPKRVEIPSMPTSSVHADIPLLRILSVPVWLCVCMHLLWMKTHFHTWPSLFAAQEAAVFQSTSTSRENRPTKHMRKQWAVLVVTRSWKAHSSFMIQGGIKPW